jgi:hypothetical protein
MKRATTTRAEGTERGDIGKRRKRVGKRIGEGRERRKGETLEGVHGAYGCLFRSHRPPSIFIGANKKSQGSSFFLLSQGSQGITVTREPPEHQAKGRETLLLGERRQCDVSIHSRSSRNHIERWCCPSD